MSLPHLVALYEDVQRRLDVVGGPVHSQLVSGGSEFPKPMQTPNNPISGAESTVHRGSSAGIQYPLEWW